MAKEAKTTYGDSQVEQIRDAVAKKIKTPTKLAISSRTGLKQIVFRTGTDGFSGVLLDDNGIEYQTTMYRIGSKKTNAQYAKLKK